jgi:predicted transcriptional regulator
MNYEELIAKALNGRSVNSMAKQWGVNQPTLDRYVKGQTMPSYDIALKIINEAGIDISEGMTVLAEEERNRRSRNFKLTKQQGFVQMPYLFIVGGGAFVAILSILC